MAAEDNKMNQLKFLLLELLRFKKANFVLT